MYFGLSSAVNELLGDVSVDDQLREVFLQLPGGGGGIITGALERVIEKFPDVDFLLKGLLLVEDLANSHIPGRHSPQSLHDLVCYTAASIVLC